MSPWQPLTATLFWFSESPQEKCSCVGRDLPATLATRTSSYSPDSRTKLCAGFASLPDCDATSVRRLGTSNQANAEAHIPVWTVIYRRCYHHRRFAYLVQDFKLFQCPDSFARGARCSRLISIFAGYVYGLSSHRFMHSRCSRDAEHE